MIITTDGYLRVITPVIINGKLIIAEMSVPIIEIITPTFYNIEYVILN